MKMVVALGPALRGAQDVKSESACITCIMVLLPVVAAVVFNSWRLEAYSSGGKTAASGFYSCTTQHRASGRGAARASPDVGRSDRRSPAGWLAGLVTRWLNAQKNEARPAARPRGRKSASQDCLLQGSTSKATAFADGLG
jgi:hypothetical protein